MATTLHRFNAEVKRPAEVLALFLLLAGAGAWSQNGLPSPSLPQSLRCTGFRSVQEQRQELGGTQGSLPDAPSAVPAKQREGFQAFAEARTSLIFDGTAINASVARVSPEHFAPGVTPSFSALYEAPVVQKESVVISDRYLYPSLQRQDLRYHPSTSDSFLGRVSNTASRLFITLDNSGKRRLNTSYLLATLASAAVANTTYRRYRTQLVSYQTQSVSGTFGNFGSTVGGDAGMNIFHQFWPRVQQILRGHSLKVLQKGAERTGTEPMPTTLVLTSAR
jgi:hypothetical protein